MIGVNKSVAYIALYRKWRPSTFTEVVGQDHIVSTLRNSLLSGKISHAYLFCGTRGTGKTTIAKLFSRAVNCLDPQDGNPCNKCEICLGILDESIHDVFEIDAASNTGVDNIREIKDDVSYMPSQAKYKVYIIDEVHMLSTSAFNALLKTLEEPPAHVIFILATTEPNKLPLTVLSRCQRYDFKRIDVDGISDRLLEISNDCGVVADADALNLIARLADGALRDAISLLDRCISSNSGHLTYDDVVSSIGIVQDAFMFDFSNALINSDISTLLSYIRELFMSGKDLSLFVSELITHFRNLMICKVSQSPEKLIDYSPKAVQLILDQSNSIQLDYIFCVIKELSILHQRMNKSSNICTLLETAVIRMCNGWYSNDNDDIISRLSRLEQAQFVVQTTQQQQATHHQTATNQQPSLNTTTQTTPSIQSTQAPQLIQSTQTTPSASGKPVQLAPDTPTTTKDSSVTHSSEVKAPSGSLEEFTEWKNVITDLSKIGRKVLETVLSSAQAVKFNNTTIGLIFPTVKTFEKVHMSKLENIKIVQDSIKRITGMDMNIKIIDYETKMHIKDSSNSFTSSKAEVIFQSEESEAKSETKDEIKSFFKEKDIPFDIIDE
jgi:DNA polymerase-3 subunit gamma/tau